MAPSWLYRNRPTLRPSDRAWFTFVAAVVVWDALCPRDEMLSDASRRYMIAHPMLTGAAICYTAGHLMHKWPTRVDLFTLAAKTVGR